MKKCEGNNLIRLKKRICTISTKVKENAILILLVRKVFKDQMRKTVLKSYFLKVLKKSFNLCSPTLVEICNINRTTLLTSNQHG
jgi:hypothetical protein